MNDDFFVAASPMQGFTDSAWRHFHAELCETPIVYYSPFVRIEKGEPRQRDLKDIRSELNNNHCLVPQILFKDVNEFKILTNAVRNEGYHEIDLNLGCPFVPQVKKGRGSGILLHPDILAEISRYINSSENDLIFSIKMRLGVISESEWREIADVLNNTKLKHITLHPRTAKQQYCGNLHYDEFKSFIERIEHKIIFNGEIKSPEDINQLRQEFPQIKGVMVGRGLIARPTLFDEWFAGTPLDDNKIKNRYLTLHNSLLNHYFSTLCGESQVLTKIRPMWEHSGELFDRKKIKAVLKASSLEKYRTAVNNLRN